MTMFTVIDAGSYKTKVEFGDDRFSFESVVVRETAPRMEIAPASESKENYSIQIDGTVWAVGGKANYYGRGGGRTLGMSKVHNAFKVRILTALGILYSRFAETHFDIATLIPYTTYLTDRVAISNMLKGEHNIIINKEPVTIVIESAKVLPEGYAILKHNNRTLGEHIVFDLGGSNAQVLVSDGTTISTKSETLPTGAEQNTIDVVVDEFESLLQNNNINRKLPIVCVGGVAKSLQRKTAERGFNSEVYTNAGMDSTEFGNAKATYDLLVGV